MSYDASRIGTALAVWMLLGTGCESLPGTREEQGAAIGGAAGAATGAVLAGEDNRLLGALLGGALGAGGGYVIGAKTDWFEDPDAAAETREAARKAEANPASALDALEADTGDLNGDGFVTLDEVMALERAGLGDEEILDRLRATGQVFDLSPDQERRLRNAGVSQAVVDQLPGIHRDARERVLDGR